MKTIQIDIYKDDVKVSALGCSRLTKDEEINLVKALAARLPDGYLSDMLRHLSIQFESDTRSDFPCIPNLAKIEAESAKRAVQLSALQKQVRQLKEAEGEAAARLRNARVNLHGVRRAVEDSSRLALSHIGQAIKAADQTTV